MRGAYFSLAKLYQMFCQNKKYQGSMSDLIPANAEVQRYTRCKVCAAAIPKELLQYGADRCAAHGGKRVLRAALIKTENNYRLRVWQQRLDEKSSAPRLKSLREEIGILRILVEERLNAINAADSTSIAMAHGPVAETITKIRELVQACHKIEKEDGSLLDKATVIQLAQAICGVASKVISSLPISEVDRGNAIDALILGIGEIMNGLPGAAPAPPLAEEQQAEPQKPVAPPSAPLDPLEDTDDA